MSRIGKAPVDIPKGVTVTIERNTVSVKGPKGALSQTLPPEIAIKEEDGQLLVLRPTDHREHRAKHGLVRALINNMVVGVTTGFKKELYIEGVGYRAQLQGKTLVLNVGYSHPIEFNPPADMSFEVDKSGRSLVINGIDKQMVGEVAARIRKTRPPEPYKGKGIRYVGEQIRRKAGKAGKAK